MPGNIFLTSKAAEAQRKLSMMRGGDPIRMDSVKTLGGVDVAYDGDMGYAAAVVVNYPNLKVVDESQARRRVQIPYIPTYLGFREAPLMAEAIRGMEVTPDVTLVDGHGASHPRGFGLATHLGVILNMATVGVAKTHLYGDVRGEAILGVGGRVIGRVITLKAGRQVYVSVGYRVRLLDAVELVMAVSPQGAPIPLRLAHKMACEAKRSGDDVS